MLPAGQQGRTDHHSREAQPAQHSGTAAWHQLAEDGKAGRDRQHIGQQGSDTRRRERSAALERQLDTAERQAVAGGHQQREKHNRAQAADSGLRRHVAGRIQQTARDGESGTWPQCSRGRDGGPGQRYRDRDPDQRTGRRVRCRPGTSRQGQPDQQQADDGCHHGGSLAAGQPRTAQPHQQRQQADAAGRDCLDQGQRRQRQRDDVERPPGQTRDEPGQPQPVAEQRRKRAQRPADRQRWQIAGHRVLHVKTPAERGGGEQREHQARR